MPRYTYRCDECEEVFEVNHSMSIKLIHRLIKLGAIVKIHDPKALDNARKIFHDNIKYANSTLSALKNSQCAIIMTKWKEYEGINNKTTKYMDKKFIIDTRRILSNKNLDVKYYGIGLG